MRLEKFASLVAGIFILASGLCFSNDAAGEWGQKTKVGEVRSYFSESSHPYPSGGGNYPLVWTDTISSPGATFIRIHFSSFQLAEGDYLTVANRDGSQLWTYTNKGPRGNGQFWAFAIDGDTVVVRIHGGLRTEYGYRIDAIGHGTKPISAVPEVVCGDDGREDVACHRSDPGFDAAQMPVSRLLFVSGAFLYACTGWLVDGSNPNTLMTNNHCISNQKETSTLQARFNYQRRRCGGTKNAMSTNYAGGTFLKTNSVSRKGAKDGLDYTLLTLAGNPEATWGELIPTRKSVNIGDQIWFIQHPGGGVKKVGFYEDAAQTLLCDVDDINQTYGRSAVGSQTAYECDSIGGSSGSPIIDPATGHVIALHHFGGVSSSECLNSGTEMSAICSDAGSLLRCVSN